MTGTRQGRYFLIEEADWTGISVSYPSVSVSVIEYRWKKRF